MVSSTMTVVSPPTWQRPLASARLATGRCVGAAAARPAPVEPPPPAGGAGGPAFVCPCCKQEFGDPLYHGPLGHAPQELCFDCWASEWAQMDQVISRGGNWQPRDAALFLLCQGYTHQEAADLIGANRTTVFRWIREIRHCPGLVPEWMFKRADFRRGVRR